MDFQSIALPTELQGHTEGKAGSYASGGQILSKRGRTVHRPAISRTSQGFKETDDSSRMPAMGNNEIEAEALKLDPKARARLAEKLLRSLEQQSEEENERLWVEEALRRDAEWDARGHEGKPAADALRVARAKLK